MSNVQVRFFASLRDEVGTDGLSVPLDGPSSLDALLSRLETLLSPAAFAALTREQVRIALNQELIQPPCQIEPGDELAFLPPVTGG